MFFSVSRPGRNDLWRYIIVILIIIVLQFIGSLPVVFILTLKMLDGSDVMEFQENFDFSAIGIDQNIGLLLMLIPFILCFLAMLLILPKLHYRPLVSFFTGYKKIRWNKIWFSVGLWLVLVAFSEIVLYLINPDNYIYQLDIKKFIPLVFIAVLFVPMQAGFEELLFRGYLFQGIGLIGVFRWVPLIITSVAFGLMHSLNPEVEKYGFWLSMPNYVGFGLLLGILVIMDDGIEMPLGIHAINNIYSFVLVTFSGSVGQTPTLFRIQEFDPITGLISWLVVSVIFVIIVAKKYNWNNWSKLFGRIPKE
ncbi:MAG: CPBP family intramembrane metalloprotease [Bacteroidales bacterium]|nr:CPBP family intramembrane metalloprotease [Bacteroidales bacterium]